MQAFFLFIRLELLFAIGRWFVKLLSIKLPFRSLHPGALKNVGLHVEKMTGITRFSCAAADSFTVYAHGVSYACLTQQARLLQLVSEASLCYVEHLRYITTKEYHCAVLQLIKLQDLDETLLPNIVNSSCPDAVFESRDFGYVPTGWSNRWIVALALEICVLAHYANTHLPSYAFI